MATGGLRRSVRKVLGRAPAERRGIAAIARRYNATRAQIALAWLLRRTSVMLPIPGTSNRKHLDENVAASAISLTDEEFAALK